jgi:drug/metabolite transporter (DMT)-like permease
VLIGCISLVALNRAIERLGAERSSALVAFVPALSALLALFFLGEVPSAMETAAILAISAGVTIAAAPAPRTRLTAAVLLRGAPR